MKQKDEGPSDQFLLPGLGRTPRMENHPPPAIVPAREVGNHYQARHDGIAARFSLTDAVKHWNQTRDVKGKMTFRVVAEKRYGRLTAQLHSALGLTPEQRRAVSEKRNFRDNIDSAVLSVVGQAELILARRIMASVDSKQMTHGQIHASYTKALKQIAPPMVQIIQRAKEMT